MTKGPIGAINRDLKFKFMAGRFDRCDPIVDTVCLLAGIGLQGQDRGDLSHEFPENGSVCVPEEAGQKNTLGVAIERIVQRWFTKNVLE